MEIKTVKDLITELKKYDGNMPIRSGKENRYKQIELKEIPVYDPDNEFEIILVID